MTVVECKCGCGQQVTGARRFIDKEHQIEWMLAGGGRELNARQSLEAKRSGGQTAGHRAAASGRLAEAGQMGALRSQEIAREVRQRLAAEDGRGGGQRRLPPR